MFDLGKTSVINLKELTVDSINENRIFPLDPQDVFKYCLHSFDEHKPVRET